MGFELGRVLGFPVRVDPTAILLLVVFGLSAPTPVYGAMVVVTLILAVLLHELGHALVVHRLGGHPEITLYGLGGLTSYRIHPTHAQQFLISVVGPGVNFLLAALAYLVLRVVPPTLGQLLVFLDIFWWYNLILGVFNLLPIVPLDGGQAMRALLRRWIPRRADLVAAWISVLLATPIAAYGLATRSMLLLIISALLVWRNAQAILQGGEA